MIRLIVKPLSGRQKRNNVAWILILLIIMIYSVWVNPAESNITTCRFHELTGLDCPTCGISRSFFAFSRFNFLDAFKYHIFGPVLFTLFLIFFIYFTIELITKKNIKIESIYIKLKWLSWILISTWIVTWLFKIVH